MMLTTKQKLLMNKPIYAGMTILDIAKTVVYQFHYHYMVSKYLPDRCRLLFTDTDSLTYEVRTDDIYEDMKPVAEELQWLPDITPTIQWDEQEKSWMLEGREQFQ